MAKAWKAAWYPYRSTGIPGQLRYWDGTAWTDHWSNPSLDAARRGEMAKRGVAAPAAWHPDPTEDDPGRLRWFDGRAWTAQVHDGRAAASPAPAAPEPASKPAAASAASPVAKAAASPVAKAAATPAAKPASAASKPSGERRSKRNRVIRVTALVTAGVLVLSGITWVVFEQLRPLPVCGEADNDYTLDVPIERLPEAKPVCTDPIAGLDYTAPVTGLTERDVTFTFPAKVSRDEATSELDLSLVEFYTWGFQVFADAGLTVELPFSVVDAEDGWEIGSLEAAWYDAYFYPEFQAANGLEESSVSVQLRDNYEATEVDGEMFPQPSQWGFRDVYYLVRYVDDKGRALERPVVSEFRFEHELATPRMSVGTDPDSPGTLLFEWAEVPGAEWYAIVVGSTDSVDGVANNLRDYDIVGTSEGTTWSADESFAAEQNEGWQEEYRAYQNYSLESFQFREDYEFDADDYDGWDVGDFEYGIVAIAEDAEGERITSAYGAVNALDVAASGVYALSEFTWLDRWGGQLGFGTEFASFDDIPTSIPLLTLDGKVVESPAVLVGATVVRYDEHFAPGYIQVGLFASGTQLGFPVFVPVPEGEDALDLVDRFNERALFDSPLQGAAAETLGHFVITEATLLEAAPQTDYPVHQGSHPFVAFLGDHLVARTEAIDISRWIGQPGLPDIYDALLEAWSQNPYAYVESVSWYDNVIYVYYSYDEGAYEQHQAELKSAVEQTVAAIITPGMGARDQAKAINAFLVSNVEYDYTALDVVMAYSGSYWREYALEMGQLHAWEANGVFAQRTVVCAGYAIAFSALAMEIGLPVEWVTGVVTYNGGLHAWTKVQVDGTWYAVDSTWNDSWEGNKYLLIKDSQFTGYARRSEDSYWVLDGNLYLYATP